jgi:hypothetical protein
VGAIGEPGPPPTGDTEQPETTTSEDRWGLDEVLERVPEHVREFIPRDQLRSHLDQRVTELDQLKDRYGPYNDALAPLLEDRDPESGATQLDALLGFYELTARAADLGEDGTPVDPEAHQEMYDWWEQVGEQLGYFGEDEDGGDDDPAGAGEGGGEDEDELRQMVEELQGRLAEFETNGRVESEQQRLERELEELMDKHEIKDEAESEDDRRRGLTPRGVILRLAQTYSEEPNAIELAVGDYLRLTGKAQSALVSAAGEQTAPLQGGPSLERGNTDTEPEPIRSRAEAKQAALARMRAAPG